MSSESPIRSLSPVKTSPARRAALSWRAREADRVAGGTFTGHGHALKAHQTPFSAEKRGIHHHGVKTSTREHCVPGAEAPAVPGELQRLGEKQRPADGAKTPGTDEEPLLGCTCVKTPSDRTDNPQLPHEQTALPQPRPRRRCPPAVQVGASCPDLSHLPKHLGGRCIYHSAGCATPVDGVDPCAPVLRPLQWCGSWRLDGLWLSLDESHSMLPTH